MKKSDSNKELAGKIVDEVAAIIPTQFERNAVRQRLLDKVEKILGQAGMTDSPPQSRSVTILLSDIRGFTALAETYSAMTVMDILNRYFAAMSSVIVNYGGTIDKLMGDSIMVLFGAPHSGSDDVQRAVACAIAMQQAMSDFNQQNVAMGLPELYMGIGINSGTVVAGPIGSDHHREYTVIGDEVNLASRIEAQSLRGQILISENTYRLARDFVLVGEPNRVQVKGKKQPVSLYELFGTTRPRAMTVPRRETRKSPRARIYMPCYFQHVEGKRVVSQEFRGEVIDIGYNGLLMTTSAPLEHFAEIKLTVSLQLLGSETSDIYARVVKTGPVEEGYQSSLEFTSIGVAGQATIKRFVDNLLFQS